MHVIKSFNNNETMKKTVPTRNMCEQKIHTLKCLVFELC